MAASKVFWTDLRTTPEGSMPVKLDRLLRAAGLLELDWKKKLTALKIHFGEPGNMAYIRPPYVAVISRLIRDVGGRPFLTDANTLYSGRRHNAYDHIRAALENGFSRDATGCDILIADGLLGNDFAEMPVEEGRHCAVAMIGSGIAEAAAVVSLNHFKGHELVGFGGAVKNLGMGCASVAGKRFLHEVSHPVIVREACTGCGSCVSNCAAGAVTLDSGQKAVIDHLLCTGCCQCVAVCSFEAARAMKESASVVCGERIAEYAAAVVRGKPAFHVNFVMNVSPNCDCWAHNDAPVVADIGIFAGTDAVALDQACVDAVNSAPAIGGTALTDKSYSGAGEKFGHVHPDTDWSATLDHCVRMNLGSRQYALVRV